MCTVTYLPTSEDIFVLTSNRDEAPKRSAEKYNTLTKQGIKIVFPQDKGAGGTWIAMSSSNRVVCLLNGAFKKHIHQPPYKRSRGIMLLEFFDFAKAEVFFEKYDFERMEPFTFIIAEYGMLWELRWDEKKLHILELDANDSHIWASCTLYDEEFQQKRRDWFEDWKKAAAGHFLEKILDFHFNAGEGDVWNNVQMNRNEKVKTIGITRVEKAGSTIKMIYFDLIKKEDMEEEVRLGNLNYEVISRALLT